MNIQRTILLFIFLFSSLACFAQEIQVYEMNIKRPKENLNTKDKLEVKLFVPMEVTDFVTINKQKTSFSTIIDDTGYDLLAAHNKEQQKIADKWYYYPAIITGFGSDHVDSGIRATIQLKAAPAPGAKMVTVEGTMALDFDTGNASTLAQTGSNLLSLIHIEGRSNRLEVNQSGNNLDNLVQVLGAGLTIDITQDAAGFHYSQAGAGNPITITSTARNVPVIIHNN
jgi:hypothetical protein